MNYVNKFTKYLGVVAVSVSTISCSSLVEDDYADEALFTDSGFIKPVGNVLDSAAVTTAAAIWERGVENDEIDTKDVSPTKLVDFATTLIGTPYKYGSAQPEKGFDCSGFISYVFNHFDIAVPRSSKDFTDVGKHISRVDARQGDLILFTGTNVNNRAVGHMGIVTFNNPDTLLFIHSTSGKLNSVTVTPLNEYYKSRFVKIVRIFPENDKSSKKG